MVLLPLVVVFEVTVEIVGVDVGFVVLDVGVVTVLVEVAEAVGGGAAPDASP